MFLTGIQSRENISKLCEGQSLGPCNSKKLAVVEMFLFCNCKTKYSILAYRKKLFSLYCSLEQPSKNTLETKKLKKIARYNIFIDPIQIYFSWFWDVSVSSNVSSFFWEQGWGFFCLSLLLGKHFLQVLPFTRCLSSITKKKLAGNRFQTDKGAIESHSRLLPPLMLWMDYVHRCICTSYFHPHIYLPLVSITEAYFTLCGALSSFINKTRDLSLTAQIWIHWSRNKQKNTWAHIIYHLCLYLQLLPDLLALGEYLLAELSITGFQTVLFQHLGSASDS